MTRERISALSIGKDCTLIGALKRMDETEAKLLMVTDDGHLLGLLSIGDVQRGILARLPMSTPAGKILRKDFLYCGVNDNPQKIRELMLENRCEYMPLVGENFTLVKSFSACASRSTNDARRSLSWLAGSACA